MLPSNPPPPPCPPTSQFHSQGELDTWNASEVKALLTSLDLIDWHSALLSLSPSIAQLLKIPETQLMKLVSISGQPMPFGLARMLLLSLQHIHQHKKLLPFVAANIGSILDSMSESSQPKPGHALPSASDWSKANLWNVEDVITLMGTEHLLAVAEMVEAEQVNGMVLLSCTSDADLQRLGASTKAERNKLKQLIAKLNSASTL
jgi:hypothetical protein